MSLWKTLKKFRNEKGAVFVLTAVLLPVMLGFMGLGYDVGNLYMHKASLQHAADSAAYAGSGVYYEMVLDANVSDDDKPNADVVVGDDGNLTYNETLNANRKAADAAANEYIGKNKANLTSEIKALQGNVPVQGTSSGIVPGVLYRVRASESVPLYFMPILMGRSSTQTVTAEAVVAFSTQVSTSYTQEEKWESEYTNVFNNLFSYKTIDKTNFTGTATGEDNAVKSSKILDQYAYMMYINGRYTDSTLEHDSSTLNSGGLYDNWESYRGWWDSGDTTLNGYYNYPYYQSTEKKYHMEVEFPKLSGSNSTYTVNINSQLRDYGSYYYRSSLSEKLAFYLYQEYQGNAVINVNDTNANTNADCFPILFVQRGSFVTDTSILENQTVTVNIGEGKVFRGVIYAPYGTVTINNNGGTFKGSVIANKVIINGTGTFTQENFFKDSSNSDFWWIVDYINTEKSSYTTSDGTAYKENVAQLLKYFFEEYAYNEEVNLARVDSEGNSLGTWYTYLYETLKVGGGLTNLGSTNNRTRKGQNGNTPDGYLYYDLENTQSWFENLDIRQKSRLARFWKSFLETYEGKYIGVNKTTGEYYTSTSGRGRDKTTTTILDSVPAGNNASQYDFIQISSDTLPWTWAQTAEVKTTTEVSTSTPVKSYIMISSNSDYNLFNTYGL